MKIVADRERRRIDAEAPACHREVMNHRPHRSFALAVTLASLGGCAGADRAGDLDVMRHYPAVREELVLFDGHSGERLSWSDLLDRADGADVVIVGELHDDHIGHRVQLALVEDAVERHEGVALSMEMLDRSEQHIVDDYLADLIDREEFIQETAATSWRTLVKDYFAGEISRKNFRQRILRPGWPDWENNYQPIIDAAKDGGARIIAANAPWARYSDLVTAEGYDDLETLTPAQRRLVETAEVPETGTYRENFWNVMVGRPEEKAAATQPDDESEADDEEAGDDDDRAPSHMELSDEQVRRSFYAQMMYDATMGDSIAEALADGATKVIHLVGQFHSDFEGGTVMELRRRAPGATVLTVSMQREAVDTLREDDRDRADIVIYTRPPEG